MEFEEQLRDELIGPCLEISEDSLMIHNIDSFVALSRKNASVQVVALYLLFDSTPGENYEVWDKVG
jgi:hypothetical protein